MRSTCLALVILNLGRIGAAAAAPLPFNYQIEVFREKDTGVTVFALRLEQPFLAEEFEKSNFLRLQSLDRNSYLIYPQVTKFDQKHAEFYGRLRGDGETKLRLSYETVSENLDGTRKVSVRDTEITVSIPPQPTGSSRIFQQWAGEQNSHFANLLEYYPDESFFQYVLLQSRDRYGVEPPAVAETSRPQTENELYRLFSGGLTMQQALQYETFESRPNVGDLNVHVSQLTPPPIQSLDYKSLLEKQAEKGIQPQPQPITQLVPTDQYLLHFHSAATATKLMEFAEDWGNSVLRLFTVNAREHNLRRKFEDQLCLSRTGLSELFAAAAITEMAVTGSDLFVAEGADLTMIFRVKDRDMFHAAAERWLERVQHDYPNLQVQEFNYRGRAVTARYTTDRMVSSFVVTADDFVVFSNSHRAIRKVVDTLNGTSPKLFDALDYRYVTTLLPPSG